MSRGPILSQSLPRVALWCTTDRSRLTCPHGFQDLLEHIRPGFSQTWNQRHMRPRRESAFERQPFVFGSRLSRTDEAHVVDKNGLAACMGRLRQLQDQIRVALAFPENPLWPKAVLTTEIQVPGSRVGSRLPEVLPFCFSIRAGGLRVTPACFDGDEALLVSTKKPQIFVGLGDSEIPILSVIIKRNGDILSLIASIVAYACHAKLRALACRGVACPENRRSK